MSTRQVKEARHQSWAWFERLIGHGADLLKAGVPVVLAGDYNVVPTAQDIYPTRSLDNNALIQPPSRKAYAQLLAQGWTDALSENYNPRARSGHSGTTSETDGL